MGTTEPIYRQWNANVTPSDLRKIMGLDYQEACNIYTSTKADGSNTPYFYFYLIDYFEGLYLVKKVCTNQNLY